MRRIVTVILHLPSTQTTSASTGMHPVFPKTTQPDDATPVIHTDSLRATTDRWALLVLRHMASPTDVSPKYTDIPSNRERGPRAPCSEGFEREGGTATKK